MSAETTAEKRCLSCGALLQGDFCHRCGEKVVHPKHDYSLFEFIEQTIDGFTHFDLKFLRSFKYLLFWPGLLSQLYVEGQRIKLMRPIQLFIVCSLLFYFFMPNSGSFYSSYPELDAGYRSAGFDLHNPVKYNIRGHLRERAIVRAPQYLPDTVIKLYKGRTLPDSLLQKVANGLYRDAYQNAAPRSKTWLFLLLPVWALLLFALFYRQQHYYVPHLIFAMHLLCFFLLTDLIFLIFFFDIVGVQVVENHIHLAPFFAMLLLYCILAVKRFYRQRLFPAIWKGLLVYLFLLILLIIYRVGITAWAIQSV
jgi:hypothetical protein